MAYRAVVDIPRAREAVWGVLTDGSVWAEWWEGPIAAVDPGWGLDGTVTWGDGGTATIAAFDDAERLELVSEASGTRWIFQLAGAPGGGTRFIFVEDFSDSTVKIARREEKLAQNEARGARFRDAVLGRTEPAPKWWKFWK
ncbi:MAG: SRPBCC family protein [Gemmatimonadota bacterium]|jgi:uncharacterized protein YndB with AHSA1/START domain